MDFFCIEMKGPGAAQILEDQPILRIPTFVQMGTIEAQNMFLLVFKWNHRQVHIEFH